MGLKIDYTISTGVPDNSTPKTPLSYCTKNYLWYPESLTSSSDSLFIGHKQDFRSICWSQQRRYLYQLNTLSNLNYQYFYTISIFTLSVFLHAQYFYTLSIFTLSVFLHYQYFTLSSLSISTISLFFRPSVFLHSQYWYILSILKLQFNDTLITFAISLDWGMPVWWNLKKKYTLSWYFILGLRKRLYIYSRLGDSWLHSKPH